MNTPALHTDQRPLPALQPADRKAEPVHGRSGGDSPPSQRNRSGRNPSAKVLLGILQEEVSLHEELLHKKREERPCLAMGAVTQLQKITDDLQRIVEKIRRVEERRAEEMARWAEVLGCGAAHVTLRRIARHLPPEEGEPLIEIGDRLRALVIRVRDENNMNQLLLRRSLHLANEEMRMLTSANEECAAYTPQGSVSHQKASSSRRLVDCRA